MSDWHVWLFYGTAAFISVYSVITWKQIMWLYTLASPYVVDDNNVANKDVFMERSASVGC